jgi:hypothetical protein
MQLSKLILYNTILYPPSFDDLEVWIEFRRIVNSNLNLKEIVNHWVFHLVVAIYTTICCANALILLYQGYYACKLIDYVFIWLFVTEIILNIVGNGP